MNFDESGIVPQSMLDDWKLGAQASELELLEKATTTGSGIVPTGSGGAGDGAPLRTQFLHNTLETALYSQEDAVTMKLFPVEKVYSTTVEFSTMDKFGGDGDGFVGETGSDGNFGLNTEDDTYTRRTRNVKFLGTQAEISSVAQAVKNLKDPIAAAELSSTTRLITRANLAMFFGDETFNNLSFSGLSAQIHEHVRERPENRKILIDAAGGVIDATFLAYAQKVGVEQFGKPALLLQDAGSYADTEAALFPNQRGEFGSTGQTGGNRKEFVARFGKITREYDAMLRPNRPLGLAGNNVTGCAKATADAGSGLTYSATPWVSGSGNTGLADPGTASFFLNVTRSGTAPTAAPARPAKTDGGNAGTRLKAKTYYYGVSFVVGGKESAVWVFGASAAGTFAGATGVVVADPNASTSSIVKLVTDQSQFLVGGAAVNWRTTRVRIYRAEVTPGSFNDFNLLTESGIASSGNTIVWDNGMYIAGCNTNYLLTPERNGLKSIIWAQLLPMIKRALPQTALSDRFAMLMFGTPIMWLPNFQIEIRNVKSDIAGA